MPRKPKVKRGLKKKIIEKNIQEENIQEAVLGISAAIPQPLGGLATADTAAVIAELMETGEGRRGLSAQSPVFFDTYYCGMRYAEHRERWLGFFEAAISTAKETGQKRKLLLLAPRDHGKTEACVTLAVRTLCIDRNARILWICESEGQAKKRVRRVKAVLNSLKVRDDWCANPELGFGPWKVTDEDKWSDKEVYINRSTAAVDPSLEAVGSGGAITGGHFDLIICDDLEDDKTTYTSANRKKTRDWFKGTVNPMLVRTGTMIVVGTRKHHDDLYGHFLEDPTFQVIEDKAIIKWPDKFSYTYETIHGKQVAAGVKIVGETQVLWHERPIEYLLLERLSVQPLIFSREFQNEVQDDSASAFQWAWLQAAKSRGRGMSLYEIPPDIRDLDIVQGWDFALVQDAAGAEARDTDFTVGITWGRDIDGNRYLLGLKRLRGVTSAKIRETVTMEYHRLVSVCTTARKTKIACPEAPRVVSVERNNFGELHFLGLQRTTDLPLKPHLTTGAKKADPWEGVPSLSALFENNKVFLPCRTEADEELVDILVQELWGLGREKHDDTVLSLWIAETQLRKPGFVHQVSFGDTAEQTFAAEADERALQADLLSEDEVDRLAESDGQSGKKRLNVAPEAWGGLNLGKWD